MTVILGTAGVLLYRPIDLEMSRLQIALADLSRNTLPRVESGDLSRESEELIIEVWSDLKTVCDSVVPRGEHEQKWRN
jgi:hypothetical protein